jgi:uncharacterized protein
MRIFDAHAHVFPEKIATKAVRSIGDYYGIPMQGGEGTAGDLIAQGDEAGVSGYLIHSTATKPEQIGAINAFIKSLCEAEPRFIGFGTLHPDSSAPEADIAQIEAFGLRGVKLHPDFQGFAIDEPKALALFKLIEGRLPVLVHMGDENSDFSSPARLARVIEACPGLTVIAAHLGGYRMWDQAKDILAGSGAWFDCSSSLAFLSPERAREQIEALGADRVLFGSDYPMWRVKDEVALLQKLGLSAKDMEGILHGNAEALLGL